MRSPESGWHRWRVYNAGLREKKRAPWIAASGRVPSEEHGVSEKGVLESEICFDLGFDSAGERVFAGTAEGLREYRYADMLAAREQMPVPIGAVERAKCCRTTGMFIL